MGFYDLSKGERIETVQKIHAAILRELQLDLTHEIIAYFDHEDTYIRKSAYLSVGKIYKDNTELHGKLITSLTTLLSEQSFRIRQTAINAAGEIGKVNFEVVQHIFDTGLFDEHHSPRNAVIGSVKKMGEVNPSPVLSWARTYLHHPDKEIRREICHGIELRGRKHPQDILPMLQELEFDQTSRVRKTLIHVVGQISYKKGCLATVVEQLKTWKNEQLVHEALLEIIDVHERYKDFSVLTQKQAKAFIINAGFELP